MNDLFSRLPEIEQILRYSFKQKNLLSLAFIHRSFFNENRELVSGHNERLEFLGDAVLGLVISSYLYEHLPSHAEGHLSHLRAQIVGADSCAEFTRMLRLEQFLQLGKGEVGNVGRGRDRILANLLEAVIGAVYLDGGLQAARDFILGHFHSTIDALMEKPLRNWKADLQDFAQKRTQKPPEYRTVRESGPAHSKRFEVAVFIENMEMGRGEGGSKKEAEQAAAEDAITQIEESGNGEG